MMSFTDGRRSQLQELFAELDDQRVTIEFTDRELRDLEVVSVSHVLLNDTVIAVPFGSEGEGGAPGVQFSLDEVAAVWDCETHAPLFPRLG